MNKDNMSLRLCAEILDILKENQVDNTESYDDSLSLDFLYETFNNTPKEVIDKSVEFLVSKGLIKISLSGLQTDSN